MLPVDLPTVAELKALAAVRGSPCVSIYLETTPITQHSDASRITFGNLTKEVLAQLEGARVEKRIMADLIEPFEDLADDNDFWAHQARSLAVLATPTSFRTFRLANRLSQTAHVSDRFHLKPLLRAVTFPHAGMILALSENSVRLIEFFADLPPEEVRVPDLPKDAASHVGKASINDRSHSSRIHGSEGKKIRLRQYVRAVDAAIRPILAGSTVPLILAANEPLASIFRHECSHAHLAAGVIRDNIERLTLLEMAAAARPILDAKYAQDIEAFKALYAKRTAQRRVTTELMTVAQAATFGAIETMMVDIDAVMPGTIDDETGAVTLADEAGPDSYGVVDQIAVRALTTGADVLGVRKQDLPNDAPVAAILRHAM